MAHNKLNVFHWHLTDGQCFPIELPSWPELSAYGAYSDQMKYSAADMADIVDYAEVRGIRVIPELDTPAHAGNGWQFGEIEGFGKLSLCINRDDILTCPGSGSRCGVLNAANPNLYDILEDIYSDLAAIFKANNFHMGGDEVSFDCWKISPEIDAWLDQNGLSGIEDDYFTLWEQFQANASDRLTLANEGVKKDIILWTSTLTESNLGSISAADYTIQIWDESTDETVTNIISNDFKVIISNSNVHYLNCGRGRWAAKG